MSASAFLSLSGPLSHCEQNIASSTPNLTSSLSLADYACAIVGFIHLVAGVYWFFGGKTKLVRHSKTEDGEGSEIEK
jgi:hypothetical protein